MKPAFTIHSDETGTDYLITVAAPDVLSTGARAPALLFMDGDDQFKFGVAAYRELQKTGQVPPLFLVGVGYGASYSKPANRRGRDYTPVAHSDEPTSGGADRFLRFLTTTFWEGLNERYPIENRIRGIAGHSLGSLLVLHALFQPTPFFTHHLASAPSIWWADRAILNAVRVLRQKQTELSAKLYLSVGQNDSNSMTGDLTLLETALKEKPFKHLDVVSKRFADRDHYDVITDAFHHGIDTLFGEKRS